MTTLHREPEPEGECIFRVASVVQDDDAIVWSFFVDRGKCQGSHLRHITLLTPDHLWKLRNLLETLGIEIIDGPMDLKLNEYVGLTVAGLVRDGQIIDFWPVEEAAAKDAEFIDRTQRAVDETRANLDRAIEAYARARVAECEDIERQRWRHRSMAR